MRPSGRAGAQRRPRRSAALAAGAHPAPCRTRKLSPPRADGTAGAAPWESRSPPIDEADGSRRACWPRRAAALAAGEHPAPCRTRKLSPPGADGTAGAAPWESRSPPPDAGSMREGSVGERPRAPLFCLRWWTMTLVVTSHARMTLSMHIALAIGIRCAPTERSCRIDLGTRHPSETWRTCAGGGASARDLRDTGIICLSKEPYFGGFDGR